MVFLQVIQAMKNPEHLSRNMNSEIRKIRIVLAILSVLCGQLFGQGIAINGIVTDAATGERLIGVSVYDSVRLNGISTNNFGFYSLTIPEGDPVYIKFSLIGYQSKRLKIKPESNQSVNIALQSVTSELNEIIIRSEQAVENKTNMSTLEIPVKQIKKLPALMGETDILKAFQLMPGVQSGKEGGNALYVRGGSPDQNLILLDDVPLYYVSHLGGFVSIFDANVISNVKLIKGGFPARYGERLSSVIDIRTKDGNETKRQGEFSIGTLLTKMSLEGPLNKKTTYVVSFRRSFLDLFTRGLSLLSSGGKDSYWYTLYDANVKICNRLTDKDRLFFTFYSGSDHVGAKGKTENTFGPVTQKSKYNTGIKWGNITASSRWNHIYNSKLFSNLTIGYTRFKYSTKVSRETIDKSSNSTIQNDKILFFSTIHDIVQKMDVEYYPNPKHRIKFGNSSVVHFFNPSVSSYSQNSSISSSVDTTTGTNNKLQSYELNVYADDEYRIIPKFTVNVGLHIATCFVPGKTFISFQPRILSSYKIAETTAIKASFSTMQQPLHLLSSSTGGFPTDLWVPATKKAVPEKSMQVALGIGRSIYFRKVIAELSIEGFYKELENLIEFQEGANFFSSSGNLENKIVTGGKGEVYGIEFLLQKKEGKLTGWMGYTLSRNTRRFDNLNGGKEFPYRYDRTHDLSLVANYELSERIVFSGSWVYGTGNAITLATEKYAIQNSNFDNLKLPPVIYEDAHIYDRNAYRMPAYHKLDVSVSFIKKLKKGVRTWCFSIYNVYSRQNAYLLFYKTENNQTKLYQLSLFPIIPSISYQYKF